MNVLSASVIRMASASVLKRLTQRAEEAERIITELKGTIDILKEKAAVVESKPEELRLKQENEKLRKEIGALKTQLILAEVRNGVKQVPLPTNTSVVQSVDISKAKLSDQKKGSTQNAEAVSDQQKPSKKGGKDKKGDEPTKSGEPKAKKGKVTQAAGGGEPERLDVSRLDFRVGKIVEVEKHPDADSLYIEKVDVGEGELRTVVSGLVKHVPLDQMQNKVAVFMCNLKPAKMRGVLSQAMIMCASTPEKVEILNVPEGAAIGDKVLAQGYTGEPDVQLNPKKKVWEAIKPDLRTNNEKVATYKGAPLAVESKGHIVAPSLADVQIQ